MEPENSADRRQDTRAHELVDLRRALRSVVQRLEDALDHLGMEAQRLTDESSRLALVADKLERRLGDLPRLLDGGDRGPLSEPEAKVPEAHRFLPGDGALGIELASVPDFQGLMDVQRGLSALPAVAEANVLRYQHEEALVELTLCEPVAADQIVAGLRSSIGRQLLIENVRPEDLRLRLRFAG